MSEQIITESIPVLALRGLTVFPHATMHFDVGREKSIRALDKAMAKDQHVFLVTQRDILQDDPAFSDLYPIGTVAQVRQVLKIPGDSIRILVKGEYRARVVQAQQNAPYLRARIESVPDRNFTATTARVEALTRQSAQLFDEFCELSQRPLQDTMLKILASNDPGYIADLVTQVATYSYSEKMRVLEQTHPVKRLEIANKLLARELEVLRLENQMQEMTQQNIEKGQRDYYLREQLKVIRSELGEGDEDEDIERYREKIDSLRIADSVREKFNKELQRLMKQSYGSSESSVIRNYLDIALELPWGVRTKERCDIKAARRILDEDHFGLEKVKERILEVLAVKQLAPKSGGQIICLVGPPGVGKTSIAMSVARALGRKLARISLGGIHDEAEIRGHRKTYIGAMPGRIINAVSHAGSCNPLLLLDEIDKIGNDFHGDPSAALLEVLDSEQNSSFRDNYLEVPFDLSECMFITTANNADTIARPLLDRMELIELSSYTDEEKLMIAKRHLLPKQMKKHGVKRTQLRITDDALREVIHCYTRESGVRNFERELAAICRKCAMQLLSDDAPKRINVTGNNIEEFLGARKIMPDKLPASDPVGLVTGLAWTAVGGETLEVECNVVEGSGKLDLTGNLGDVMKESVHAAMSYIRSRADSLHIVQDFYKTKDIHVHFPEGAIPKDGPSAGITVCTAMVSALTGARVRRDIAMTGEISIRGRVLPIGGLKEKTMAALRHGVKTVIIPQENEKDLQEIDQTVRRALNFILVDHVDAVIDAALDFASLNRDSQAQKEDTQEITVTHEAISQPNTVIRQ
ncbi:MAG: endopeptidase La [Oscillospiraceae bacterium]|jgi:ATP-dependent Lon protease|nr:endopeptidase La [Oscillospiraceae bacterium]